MKKRNILIAVCLLTMFCSIGMAACKNDESQSSESNSESILKEICISKTEAEVVLNETIGLSVENAIGDIVWISDNENIATVTNGMVKGLSFGTVKITAKAQNGEVVCMVTVVPNFEERSRLTLTAENIKIYKGDAYKLEALLVNGNESEKATNVVWTTENSDVAVVENGLITATGTGKTNIIASIIIGEKTLISACEVDVILETNIVVHNESLVFTKKSQDLKLDVSCTVIDGGEQEIPVSELEFAVDEDSGVIFNQDGSFQILRGGQSEVTISYKNYCIQTYTLDIYDALISNADEFISIAENPDGYYMLVTDINFDGREYAMIPTFSGHLNGNGYTVKNISLKPENQKGIALFEVLEGTVSNIAFENVTINTIWGGMIGYSAIVANTFSGTLDNVYIQGTVHGVAAVSTSWADYTTWGIKTGTLFATSNYGVMKNCIADVSVDDGTDIKTLIGKGVLNVDNLYVYSSNTLPSSHGSYTVINNGVCLIGEKNTVLAQADSMLDKEVWDFSNGQVDIKDGCSYAMPLETHIVKIWCGETLLKTYEVETFKTLTPDMVIGENIISSYDYDFSQPIVQDLDVQATCYNKIYTVDELRAINGTSTHYILMNDIDVKNAIFANTTFLGDFSGVLDGNGYSIKNVQIQAGSQWQSAGLFTTMSGTVRNIGFENITMLGSGIGNYLGKSGFIAKSLTGKIVNIYLTGTVNGIIESNGSWSNDYRYGMIAHDATGGTVYNVRVHIDNMQQYSHCMAANVGPTHYGNYYASYTGSINNWSGVHTERDVGNQCLKASKADADAIAINSGFGNPTPVVTDDIRPYITNVYWNMETMTLVKNVYDL